MATFPFKCLFQTAFKGAYLCFCVIWQKLQTLFPTQLLFLRCRCEGTNTQADAANDQERCVRRFSKRPRWSQRGRGEEKEGRRKRAAHEKETVSGRQRHWGWEGCWVCDGRGSASCSCAPRPPTPTLLLPPNDLMDIISKSRVVVVVDYTGIMTCTFILLV